MIEKLEEDRMGLMCGTLPARETAYLWMERYRKLHREATRLYEVVEEINQTSLGDGDLALVSFTDKALKECEIVNT